MEPRDWQSSEERPFAVTVDLSTGSKIGYRYSCMKVCAPVLVG